MFNTTIIRPRENNYIPYEKEVNVTTHEHRAPTDRSIELFDEYLEKAKKYIIDSFEIKNNLIESKIFIFALPINPYEKEYACKVKINGKELMIKDKIPNHSFTLFNDSRMEIFKIIYESLSKEIAKLIVFEHQEFINLNFR